MSKAHLDDMYLASVDESQDKLTVLQLLFGVDANFDVVDEDEDIAPPVEPAEAEDNGSEDVDMGEGDGGK
jgi:hypothetical protein